MKKFMVIYVLLVLTNLCYSQGTVAMLVRLEKNIQKSPQDVQLLLDAGILCHELAMQDKKYIEKGEGYFKKVLSSNSKNSLAKVWYGSLLSIKGKYALMPWDKLKYVEQGLNQMDEAVKLDRYNIAVRSVRGGNNLSLPNFFNRIDSAMVDLNFVIHTLENQKELQNKYNLAEQYLRLAKACETKNQLEKSIKIWKKIRSSYPGTEEAKISDEKLKTLKQ